MRESTTLNKMLFNFLVMCVPIHPVRVTTQQTRLNSFSNRSISKCLSVMNVKLNCNLLFIMFSLFTYIIDLHLILLVLKNYQFSIAY